MWKFPVYCNSFEYKWLSQIYKNSKDVIIDTQHILQRKYLTVLDIMERLIFNHSASYSKSSAFLTPLFMIYTKWVGKVGEPSEIHIVFNPIMFWWSYTSKLQNQLLSIIQFYHIYNQSTSSHRFSILILYTDLTISIQMNHCKQQIDYIALGIPWQ